MRFSTKAIHVGQEADPTTGATIVPIYQTSTYTQDGIGNHKGYEYSRTGNPTRTALQSCLASLEGGKHGLAFASGTAAADAVMKLLNPGDHVICADDVYGGTYRLFELVLKRYGISYSWIDMTDAANVQKAVRPETKMIWIETPTNPMLNLVDIAAVSAIGKKAGALVVVDNTFASPYLQRPLSLGADIVVHSTTKYIGGHSDVVGGAIVTNLQKEFETIKYHQNAVGGVPGAFDCWLTLRGVKTLSVRMKAHCENAMRIAQFLSEREDVERVVYPGLASHPQHELATRQMTDFGGMVSFGIAGGLAAAKAFANKTKLFSLAESLGGVESLIGHPATMTHASIPKAERESRGITDGLLRLSVGIEDADDLIEDLEQAFAVAKREAVGV
ncbi:MAG: cystathionine gamma-synthase [Phycisphaerales bacterium]|nr:cystathionine gamma-synthase [Phycisphaerales bacterium]MCB9855005.1 cystathionine gamma-synthase [Phycisphaerales bacterium]MCB9863478.1 cystathionine gamma-synthase [Phycisphaerales bacterium]